MGDMGFRQLHAFNLAMLGKQGWRLMTNQDTAVLKVFKSKYHPWGNFLGSNVGHNPSFIWHSIHASRVIVSEGMSWKISNEKSINVWSLTMAQGKGKSFCYLSHIAQFRNLLVGDLIDQQYHKRKVHQISFF